MASISRRNLLTDGVARMTLAAGFGTGMAWAGPTLPPEDGEGWYNVKVGFGAKGNGAVDDQAAIQAAIDANSGRPKVVYFPSGTYSISNPIVVRHGVRLVGVGPDATVIKAATNFPTDGRALVALGPDNAPINARVENLTIECGGVPHSVGVYSAAINERGGLFNVTISGFMKCGVHIVGTSDGAGGNAQNFSCQTLYLVAHERALGSVGIWLDHIPGRAMVYDCTIAPNDQEHQPPQLAGIRVTRGCAQLFGVRIEGHVDGILWEGQATGIAEAVTGHFNVDNVVRIAGPFGAAVFFSHINGTNPRGTVIKNDAVDHTLTHEGTGGIVTIYATSHHATPSIFHNDASGFHLARVVSSPVTLSEGNNADYPTGSAGTVRLKGTGRGSTLTGIQQGMPGRELRLINIAGVPIRVLHQNAGSAAGNRILTPKSGVLTMLENGVVDLEYDGEIKRWRVTNTV